MEREIDLQEISDGRLYERNDLVKVGCGDCEGCSACCRGMGESILLDPLDIRELTVNLGKSFEALIAEDLTELRVTDGVILPCLKLSGEKESCRFLDGAGRCGIHAFRPGLCRLFPLGRFYENGSFRYFLQVKECRKENRTKLKIKQWLGIPEIRRYEQFIADWHYFVKDLQNRSAREGSEGWLKQMNLYILQRFFREPYPAETDFYECFYERLEEVKKLL